MRFLIPLLLMPLAALGQVTNFYFSSTNAAAGSGTLADPWKALSSASWAQITNATLNGITTYLNLQDGAVWREQWSFAGSGNPGARLVVRDYAGSTTNLPTISGADIVTGFAQYTPGAGSTWSNATSGSTYVWHNDGFVTQGPDQDHLFNHQYFIASGVLYIRWDEGNPDSLSATVEVAKRSDAVFQNGRTNVDWNSVRMCKTTSYTFRVAGTNITVNRCCIEQGQILVYLNNTVGVTCKDTVIRKGYGAEAVLIDGASNTSSWYYDLFDRMEKLTGGTITASAGVSIGMVNCTFAGSRVRHVSSSSAGMVHGFTNCIFSATANSDNTGKEIINITGSGASAFTEHCMLMLNGKTPTYRLFGVTESGTVWGTPGFRSPRHSAYMGFTVDDGQNSVNAYNLEVIMKPRFGWHVGHAYSYTSIPYYTYSNNIYQIVTNGGSVMWHSRHHSNVAETRAFSIQYTGAMTTVTMTINNTNLTTLTNGVQDLNINMVGMTSLQVQTAVNGTGRYSFSFLDVHETDEPAYCYGNVTAQDILTGPYTNNYNYPIKMQEEIFGWTNDIRGLFASLGTNYVPKDSVYPNGGQSSTVISNLIAAGFLSGRSVSFAPNASYALYGSNNLFNICVAQQLSGYSCFLGMENTSSDSSGSGNNFTTSGVTFSTTPPVWDQQYNAVFDGSAAYASRAGSGDWDYSFGDWVLAFNIYPTSGGSSVQTLWYNGKNVDNNLRVNLESGAIHVILRTNAVNVVDFQTPATITNSGWQYVFVQQKPTGQWRISLNNDDANQVVTNCIINGLLVNARAVNFGNTVYLGCGYDFTGGVRTNFYKGNMDDFHAGNFGWSTVVSTLNSFADDGGALFQYAHAVTTMPPGMWKTDYDAAYDYSVDNGGFGWIQQQDYRIMISTNSQPQSDGVTWVRTNSFPDMADWRLRPTSNCRTTGDPAILTGIANLTDIQGVPITDASGNLLRQQVSLGAFEYQPPATVNGAF